MKKIVYSMVLACIASMVLTSCKQRENNGQASAENIDSVIVADEWTASQEENQPITDVSMDSNGEEEESSEGEFISPVVSTVSDYQSVIVNDKCRLLRYTGTKRHIIVPDKVTVDGKEYETEIGAGCFRDTNITLLTLPDSVTTIPESMCENCAELENVSFSNVEQIEKNAFWKCEKWVIRLSDLNFGDESKLKKIGERAFGFSGLCGKVTIRLDMELEEGAFQACQEIDEIEVQAGVTAIPNRVFADNCRVSRIVLPATLTSIGQYAFMGNVTETIMIPKSVIEIGEHAITTKKAVGGKYNGVILGYKGSAAETYAQDHDIIFSPLD